ncbi:MAG: radical SAM protein [Fibrobacteres bacterium]|nr:radical SAM protein [Fibrobacterota bacterium]
MTRRLFYRRLASHVGYSAPFPEGIDLLLTDRCNLRCKMCDQWNPDISRTKNISSLESQELELDHWIRVIDECKPYNPVITLVGGEVLLYKGFDAIVRKLSEENMNWTLVTNGLILDRKLVLLKKYPPKEITISLDGPEDIHDEIRSYKGLYAKVISNIETIRQQLKSTGIRLHTVMTRHNLPYLLNWVDSVNHKITGISNWKFIHLQSIDAGTLDRRKQFCRENFNVVHSAFDGYMLPSEIIPAAADVLEYKRQLTLKDYNFKTSFSPDFSDNSIHQYYCEKNKLLKEKYNGKCDALWSVCAIYSNGDVHICQDLKIGSIKETSVKLAFNSAMSKLMREKYIKSGTFPGCSSCFFSFSGKSA